MDSNSAKALQRRIEQQQHWRQAEAVRDGRQPATDPDAAALIQIADGIRVYQSELVTNPMRGGPFSVFSRCRVPVRSTWSRTRITPRSKSRCQQYKPSSSPARRPLKTAVASRTP